MADEYLIYSAVSIGNAPIVLGATGLVPSDSPTSGLLATAADDGGWYNIFSLLPLPASGATYVLVHTATGLAVRFPDQAAGGPVTLQRLAPFDQNFYVLLGGTAPQNLQLQSASNSLVLTVAGSSVSPGTPINAGSYVPGTSGQLWQLIPLPDRTTP